MDELQAEPALKEEAAAIGSYLLGARPQEECLSRYVEAHSILFPHPPPCRDQRSLAFLRRHPRAMGPIDAASGLLRADSPLRQRILVMAAILETTPEGAEDFLPRHSSAARILFGSAARIAIAGMRCLIGLPLLFVSERSRG